MLLISDSAQVDFNNTSYLCISAKFSICPRNFFSLKSNKSMVVMFGSINFLHYLNFEHYCSYNVREEKFELVMHLCFAKF